MCLNIICVSLNFHFFLKLLLVRVYMSLFESYILSPFAIESVYQLLSAYGRALQVN